MNSSEVFMAPGKWAVNIILEIFKVPLYSFDETLYTSMAFVAAIIIWIQGLRFIVAMIRPTAKEK